MTTPNRPLDLDALEAAAREHTDPRVSDFVPVPDWVCPQLALIAECRALRERVAELERHCEVLREQYDRHVGDHIEDKRALRAELAAARAVVEAARHFHDIRCRYHSDHHEYYVARDAYEKAVRAYDAARKAGG